MFKWINLKTAVEHFKIQFPLRQTQGERDFEMLTKWVGAWKPLMPFDKLMTGFDKALLSAAEGLSTNGFHTFQLIFLGLIISGGYSAQASASSCSVQWACCFGGYCFRCSINSSCKTSQKN